MIEFLSRINLSLFFLINNGLHSPVNDLWIGNATYLGIGWITFPIAVLIMSFVDRTHFKRNFFLLLLSAVVEGILVSIVKPIVNSPRPLSGFAEGIKQGTVTIHVMFDSLYSRSFPSGHTQTAFCVAAFLAWLVRQSPRLVHKRWLPILFYALATIVGISRIYVGAHFPVDVLGGMIIGIFPVWILGRVVVREPVTPKVRL